MALEIPFHPMVYLYVAIDFLTIKNISDIAVFEYGSG